MAKKAVKYRDGFAVASSKLRVCDSDIVRERLMKANGWKNTQHYQQKEVGTRSLHAINHLGINEILNVENIFCEYGINAWTGESISN
jgi:hypothetical protein